MNNAKRILALYCLKRRERKRRCRKVKYWVRPIFLQRKEYGAFENLIKEMRERDRKKYINFLRTTPEQFDYIVSKLTPILTKVHICREPVSVSEKLAVTLRYLASGSSMVSISYLFRLGITTVCNIIETTCNAIWTALKDEVFPNMNVKAWLEVSNGFSEKWQFPHCLGAIDGKHVNIHAPAHSGSSYYNYKGCHSIVLLGVCDANYKFIMVDIGGYGRHSDSGIFRASQIGKSFQNKKMTLPRPTSVTVNGALIPYVLVADAAFQLTNYMMRPYPGTTLSVERQVFNYRLSRARRTIENAFGILCAKWCIFRKPILAKPEKVEAIVQATVVLHNYLLNAEQHDPANKRTYCCPSLVDTENPSGMIVPGEWRKVPSLNCFESICNISSNTHTRNAFEIREEFKEYFNGEGQVPWQKDRI